MSRKENNGGGGPNWAAANPWADDPFDDLALPAGRAAVRLPPLGPDGFRRDAFGVPEGCRTTTQVCEELAITYRQANHWVRRGYIPGLGANDSRGGSGRGHSWYWTPAQVEAARKVRDHLTRIEALKADLTACGPHCQHEDPA